MTSYEPLLNIHGEMDESSSSTSQQSWCKMIGAAASILSVCAVFYLIIMTCFFPHGESMVHVLNRQMSDVEVYQVYNNGTEVLHGTLGPFDQLSITAEIGTKVVIKDIFSRNVLHQEMIYHNDQTIATNDWIEPRFSPSGTAKTSIQFVNHEAESVDLIWIDYNGNETLIGILTPGQRVQVKTCINHVFMMKDATSKKLLMETTIHADSRVVGTRGVDSADHLNKRIVKFINNHKQEVALFWDVHPNGEKPLAHLATGKSMSIVTFIGHSLLIRDISGMLLRKITIAHDTRTIKVLE
jgi:hypothetical protein